MQLIDRLSYNDVEGAAWDVVHAPPDRQCVVALLVGFVRHVVYSDSLFLEAQLWHWVPRRWYHPKCQKSLTCKQ